MRIRAIIKYTILNLIMAALGVAVTREGRIGWILMISAMRKVNKKMIEKKKEAARKMIEEDLEMQQEELEQVRKDLKKIKCECGKKLSSRTIDMIVEMITTETSPEEQIQEMEAQRTRTSKKRPEEDKM